MGAYVISDTRIVDHELVAEYRRLAAASIERHGGKYLARGGTVETIEGDWTPELIS